MIKQAITAAAGAVIALSGVIAPQAAQAMTCGATGSLSICSDFRYIDEDGDQVWNVVVTNQYTTERMTVWCDGERMVYWESQGGGTADEVDLFARTFCAL